jgi:hypothetical protein
VVIWMSGVVKPVLASREDVGLMMNPRHGARLEVVRSFRCFAVDNGCFNAGDRFDGDWWLRYLEKFLPVADSCRFAVAPDVVGDAIATIERSAPYFDRVHSLGFPVAFVAQDGQEALPVPWDGFDCLFVGGSTAWKLSEAAYELVTEAKARGKWAHLGRCNSLRRIRAAAVGGYDSADGTFLVRAPDNNIPRMERWLDQLKRQPALFTTAGACDAR